MTAMTDEDMDYLYAQAENSPDTNGQLMIAPDHWVSLCEAADQIVPLPDNSVFVDPRPMIINARYKRATSVQDT